MQEIVLIPLIKKEILETISGKAVRNAQELLKNIGILQKRKENIPRERNRDDGSTTRVKQEVMTE